MGFFSSKKNGFGGHTSLYSRYFAALVILSRGPVLVALVGSLFGGVYFFIESPNSPKIPQPPSFLSKA